MLQAAGPTLCTETGSTTGSQSSAQSQLLGLKSGSWVSREIREFGQVNVALLESLISILNKIVILCVSAL